VHSDAFLSDWIQLDDVIIAADGGLQHCQRLGIHPAVVIGDLDSADPHALDWAKANNARVIHYPPAKNETDLELALMYAIDQGLQQIRIVGALGGRTDHAIANLLLLSQFDDPQLDIRFEDGIEEVFFIRNQSVIDGLAEDLVSLLPFDKRNVMGVTTDGLAYPLRMTPSHMARRVGSAMSCWARMQKWVFNWVCSCVSIPELQKEVKMNKTLVFLLAGLMLAGCASPAATPTPSQPTLTVMAHDSFAVSEPVVQAFEAQRALKWSS